MSLVLAFISRAARVHASLSLRNGISTQVSKREIYYNPFKVFTRGMPRRWGNAARLIKIQTTDLTFCALTIVFWRI